MSDEKKPAKRGRPLLDPAIKAARRHYVFGQEIIELIDMAKVRFAKKNKCDINKISNGILFEHVFNSYLSEKI